MCVIIGDELVRHLNVGKTMNDIQVANCVEMIIEDSRFNELNPDDLRVFCKSFLKGDYGTTYDRVDAMVIFEKLQDYFIDRRRVEKELNKPKIIPHNPEIIHKLATEVRASLANKLEEDRSKKYVGKSKTISQHQQWINQFEKLYLKKGKDLNGYRTVLKFGKRLSCVEYIEAKIEQLRRVTEYITKRYEND